jgi:SAM-dependent methyltransferase
MAASDPDGFFGEAVAADYDRTEDAGPVAPTVDFLAGLAGVGAALELGIGTGRIALPLAAAGVRVAGIELSRAMASRLAAKPGGQDIEVAIGDFAQAKVPGAFRLAYLVFNTIMNLTTQEAQVACFMNAAAHLEPGGRFVIEVIVPALRRLPPGEVLHASSFSPGHWCLDEYDVVGQGLISHHFTFRGGEVRQASTPFRYVWPAELDLMARLAGLELEGRFAGWDRAPFTADSHSHVSVWRKPQ